MTYTEFTNALHEAGWRPTADAQHQGIRNLWEQLFPEHVKIEELEQEVDSLYRQMSIGRE